MTTIKGVALLAKEEYPIYGDMLEEILSHVPLIHLIPVLQVSKSWNQAAYSSLRCHNPPKPWLILHSQATRYPYATSTHAYDPRSHVWMKISQPSIKNTSTLRSSHSNFLYIYSPSKLSFSLDPLNLTWHHLGPPLIWRADPIVAKVRDSIVVAGGTCDFEDDPLAVEIYDTKTRTWSTSESMPASLKDSAASTWLSVAATGEKLFVMEKQSGKTHCFYLKSNDWSAPHDLRPDPRCYYSVMGCMDDRLIVVGVIGQPEKVEKVKMWEVSCESFENYSEIGEMPSVLVQKLRSETFGVSSINICLGGSFVYIYNPAELEEVVVCEVVQGGACRWGSVKNAVASSGVCIMERLVLTCADVKLEELLRGMRSKKQMFEVVNV